MFVLFSFQFQLIIITSRTRSGLCIRTCIYNSYLYIEQIKEIIYTFYLYKLEIL